MQKLSILEMQRRSQLRKVTDNSNAGTDGALLARYCAFIDGSRQKASREVDRMQRMLAYETMCLKEAQQESRAHSVNGEKRSNALSREHMARIEALQRYLDQLAAQDPDMFYVQKEAALRNDMQEEHKSRLVNVPYLAQARRQIRNSLEAGIPVYLVGHLGSGKTQLAMECAEDFMREHLLQEKLHAAMEAFRNAGSLNAGSSGTDHSETDHPDTKYADTSDIAWLSSVEESPDFLYFCRIYPGIRREVQEADCHPYFIAGSHNLTAEDMFYEKTLRLTHASDSRSNQDQLDNLINGFMEFLKQNEDRMKDMNQDQKLELMLAGWKTFSNLYIAQNSGYGTTVEKIEKEVLKALREGRPLVIDEINTIAMANLIGLNDILQHHAGQTAYITGVGPVRIEDGFCLIGTGNLSTGTVSYEGTNVLNPAFQSRFTTIVYNYVPQSIDGTYDAQERPEQNELFRLMLDHLCEMDGENADPEGTVSMISPSGDHAAAAHKVSLYLPRPSVTLPQLFCLAQLSRVSQNIFEGRSSTIDTNGDTPVLNEAVLSIRNIIHVLDHWNLGEEEDLSMALWNGFLSSVTNADDRNLLLALAVRYGFFTEQEGWHVEARGRGDAALTLDDIRTTPYQHHIEPLQKLSTEDIVYILFGNGPKRTSLPADLQPDILIDEDAARNIPTASQLDAAIRDLEHASLILDQLN